ncbi:hypothetical protein [Leadbettera azotonutricia]|nr:hypothetical protein [Leadbettera azotonutricia]
MSDSHTELDNTDDGFAMWWNWFSTTMKKPMRRFNFWVYLLVGIVGAGGAGIWISFINKANSLPAILIAMLTFYPATAVASCMDFVFEDSEKKFVKGFAIISGFILFLLAFFICILSSYFLAFLACFFFGYFVVAC